MKPKTAARPRLRVLGARSSRREGLDGLVDDLNGYLGRPARQLLGVESDPTRREQMKARLEDPDVLITAVADSATAVRTLADEPTDCVVIGPGAADLEEALLSLKGLSGSDADGSATVSTRLPVIVYGEQAIDSPASGFWKRAADVCTVRQHTPDVLLDLATFFLHRPIAKLPEVQRNRLAEMHQTDRISRRRVLIVDDDIRNIFALSAILEEHDMSILSADNGRDAITTLQTEPDVEIVLMDIMMPEMDGMETMAKFERSEAEEPADRGSHG